MERRADGPDGREWIVRSYAYRRPPWRPVDPSLGMLADPDDSVFVYIPFLLLAFVLAPIGLVLVPLLVFLVEAPARMVVSLFSQRRWIEAAHEGPPASRMTWQTDAADAAAVVDQVARQLELGYERIEPYRARFLRFG
jgi:hypothetical protein